MLLNDYTLLPAPPPGAMVQVIIDQDQLKRSQSAMDEASINSTDILLRMRNQLDVVHTL